MAIDMTEESWQVLMIGFAAVVFLLINLIIAPTINLFIFTVGFSIITILIAGFLILLKTIKKVTR